MEITQLQKPGDVDVTMLLQFLLVAALDFTSIQDMFLFEFSSFFLVPGTSKWRDIIYIYAPNR